MNPSSQSLHREEQLLKADFSLRLLLATIILAGCVAEKDPLAEKESLAEEKPAWRYRMEIKKRTEEVHDEEDFSGTVISNRTTSEYQTDELDEVLKMLEARDWDEPDTFYDVTITRKLRADDDLIVTISTARREDQKGITFNVSWKQFEGTKVWTMKNVRPSSGQVDGEFLKRKTRDLASTLLEQPVDQPTDE